MGPCKGGKIHPFFCVLMVYCVLNIIHLNYVISLYSSKANALTLFPLHTCTNKNREGTGSQDMFSKILKQVWFKDWQPCCWRDRLLFHTKFANFNSFILLWWKKCVKLVEKVILVENNLYAAASKLLCHQNC